MQQLDLVITPNYRDQKPPKWQPRINSHFKRQKTKFTKFYENQTSECFAMPAICFASAGRHCSATSSCLGNKENKIMGS